jgi:hypothetical protein
MITIAEATQEAVRLALLRHHLVALRDRRPPYQDVPAGAAEVAGRLFRILGTIDLLRGARRDVRGLERHAITLVARLAEMGVAVAGWGRVVTRARIRARLWPAGAFTLVWLAAPGSHAAVAYPSLPHPCRGVAGGAAGT